MLEFQLKMPTAHLARALADCIIAATASLLNAGVFTKNVGEFELIDGVRSSDSGFFSFAA